MLISLAKQTSVYAFCVESSLKHGDHMTAFRRGNTVFGELLLRK